MLHDLAVNHLQDAVYAMFFGLVVLGAAYQDVVMPVGVARPDPKIMVGELPAPRRFAAGVVVVRAASIWAGCYGNRSGTSSVAGWSVCRSPSPPTRTR